MSIFIPNNACNQSYASPASARREEFRRQLGTLSSWQAKERKIEAELQETKRALANREERLFVLRTDFDALTLDFWKEFARELGCENPAQTIATELGHIGKILLAAITTVLFVVLCQASGNTGLAVLFCVIGVTAICNIIVNPFKLIARARKVSEILRQEQEPFWLTGGAIALSNLSITPPPGAQWWTPDRITFVFIRHVAARFTIDALKCELIWEDSLNSLLSSNARRRTGNALEGHK